MEKVLLHTCCAPCSAAIIEALAGESLEPVIYYFNPNIFPEAEYMRRKSECTKYSQSLGLTVIDGDYDHSRWLQCIVGLEREPERGSRCQKCFDARLLAAARMASTLAIGRFATTLASSRWKDLDQLSRAGMSAAATVGVEFLDRNWRRGGLTERRAQLIKQNGFYNQNYCGCEFSMRRE